MDVAKTGRTILPKWYVFSVLLVIPMSLWAGLRQEEQPAAFKPPCKQACRACI
jgi:hypothetical protein